MPVIAIIGSGHIGGTLSRKWAGTGHEVTFAARQPQKPGLQTLAQEVGARVAPTAEAVRAAEVVVFAIPGGAMAAIVPELGPLLNAKIVVDAANNVGGAAMNSAADVAAAAPGAHYFRALSSLGWEVLDRPEVEGTQADMFFCGPDGAPRDVVARLVVDVGLRPVWLGGPENAELVDGLLKVWFTLVMRQGHSRHLALKMLEDQG